MIDKVTQITKEELKWISKVEKLFANCPKRIGVFTTGDFHLTVFDNDIAEILDLEIDVYSEKDGTELNDLIIGRINTTIQIHGIAG